MASSIQSRSTEAASFQSRSSAILHFASLTPIAFDLVCIPLALAHLASCFFSTLDTTSLTSSSTSMSRHPLGHLVHLSLYMAWLSVTLAQTWHGMSLYMAWHSMSLYMASHCLLGRIQLHSVMVGVMWHGSRATRPSQPFCTMACMHISTLARNSILESWRLASWCPGVPASSFTLQWQSLPSHLVSSRHYVARPMTS